jgi:hypothetical protein
MTRLIDFSSWSDHPSIRGTDWFPGREISFKIAYFSSFPKSRPWRTLPAFARPQIVR